MGAGSVQLRNDVCNRLADTRQFAEPILGDDLLKRLDQRRQRVRTALAGDNYFRAKAYQRAADTLSALIEPLGQVIAENRLRELPGIGETIADIITKLHRTATHPLLERLRREVPEGVLEMLSIPGLRPDKIKILYEQHGIADLGSLAAAAREDRLKKVKGLGPALQRKILEGLKIREHSLGARHLHRAEELAVSAAKSLERSVP